MLNHPCRRPCLTVLAVGLGFSAGRVAGRVVEIREPRCCPGRHRSRGGASMTRWISSRTSKWWIFSWTLVAGLALFLSMATSTEAQVTASVNGTVRDTTGAVITGAEVLLHNNDTTLNRSTTTNDAGYYYIADVQPGNYELKVTRQGFRSAIQTG